MKRQKSGGRVAALARTGLFGLALALVAGLSATPASPADLVTARAGYGSSAEDREPGYRLGVFPFLPPLSLDRAFAPVLDAGYPAAFEQ